MPRMTQQPLLQGLLCLLRTRFLAYRACMSRSHLTQASRCNQLPYMYATKFKLA